MTQNIEALQSIDIIELKRTKVKELNLRLEKRKALFASFEVIQSDIESHCNDLDKQLIERDNIETRFISILSLIQELIESTSRGSYLII